MHAIKLFFMIWNYFVLYEKLLDLYKRQGSFYVRTLLSLILFAAAYFAMYYTHAVNLPITFFAFVLIAFIRYKRPLRITIIASIRSFSLSYIAFTVAAILVMPAGALLIMLSVHPQLEEFILLLLAGFLQSYLVTVPFLVDRLKRGMPFLKKISADRTGIFIGIFLLLLSSHFISNPSPDLRFTFYLSGVLISGLLIFLWWRRCLTKSYTEALKEQECKERTLYIEQLEADNTLLKEENQRLARIIHEDNKLIPAMEFSVQEALYLFKPTDEALKQTALELLSQLKKFSHERYGIISAYERETKVLPKTGSTRIDAIIHYIAQKSVLQNIDFDFALSCNIKDMIASTIQENELSSLLADLLENALIATKYSQTKRILLCICLNNHHYRIDVYDSGIPFCEDTILQLGKQQTTTHSDIGGSGIGMINIFKIKDAHAASFILDESIQGNLYTKDLAVYFDNLGQFRLKSNRCNLSEEKFHRSGILII